VPDAGHDDRNQQIMDVLARSNSNGCLLEDLLRECPDLTWNQIFLELDRLSRTGEVRLRLRGAGQYVVTAKSPEGLSQSHRHARHLMQSLSSMSLLKGVVAPAWSIVG
jgi:hypothetical protein